jgi:SAM-dependent methyltransferase
MAPSYSASLPSAALLFEQARWLAPARSALLRRAAIAHRRSVLDLGAGRGAVTAELARRSGGLVYALDLSYPALCEIIDAPPALRIVGDAHNLPFREGHLDLVFSQFTLLWVNRLASALAEIWRVLQPGGRFCAIEPDYLAMIEYPPEIDVSGVWHSALRRAGAIVDAGRGLPSLLERQGFDFDVRLLDQLRPPSPLRFAMLRELELTPDELEKVEASERAATSLAGWQQVSHLPLFVIDATRAR